MDNILRGYTVNQIGFVVMDINAAAQKFEMLTGMKIAATSDTRNQDVSTWKYRNKQISGGMRNLAFRFNNIELEFIQPEEGDNVWSDYLKEHGEGIHHIAFNVKNIPSIAEKLCQKGYALIQCGDFNGGRYAYFDTVDAIGTTIELLEFY